MSSGLWPTFVAAVQAAIGVLLTISWGLLAGYLEILDDYSTKRLSQLCVAMLLPALMVTNVGSELNPDNVARYGTILGFSLFYTISTLIVSLWLQKLFKLPPWTVVATTFNSNTSMPLLLIQTLAATGVLDGLLISETDTVHAAVNRAKSYFLANALCGNVLTFAIGPKILHSHKHQYESDNDAFSEGEAEQPEGGLGDLPSPAHEQISLLHGPVDITTRHKMRMIGQQTFQQLPIRLRATCSFMFSLVDSVLLGGIVAAVLGLVPFLHRAFFNSAREGGIFNAWLTRPLNTMGETFVALQILVVGERLSQCLRKMARGESSGSVPWTGAIPTLIIRYVIWPLISVALIYYLSTRTPLLSGDPMLPFAMMLMPCGPSAMKLAALADVAGSTPDEKMSLAKFLTISYALSPILSFAVVGSLKATEASIG